MLFKLMETGYNRREAVNYANYWAYRRNPRYYDFEEIGGDCTNFASQCLYAGVGAMNYTENTGWYYRSLNDRSPSWSGVVEFFDFIVGNTGVGPYGVECDLFHVQPGDFCQLILDKDRFQHTPIIVAVPPKPTLSNILVAAHTDNCNCRQIDTYKAIADIRFIHISGARKLAGTSKNCY